MFVRRYLWVDGCGWFNKMIGNGALTQNLISNSNLHLCALQYTPWGQLKNKNKINFIGNKTIIFSRLIFF